MPVIQLTVARTPAVPSLWVQYTVRSTLYTARGTRFNPPRHYNGLFGSGDRLMFQGFRNRRETAIGRENGCEVKPLQVDVLAFGAHPDDLELTCGGTLAKFERQGYAVAMLALTAGELSTRGSVEIRAREFAAAAAILGAAHHRILNLPDGDLGPDPAQKLVVARVIREYRPKLVLAPYWKDRHPDHANASRLVTEASFVAGLARYDPATPSHRPRRILYYASRYEFHPSFIVDVSETHDLKMQAIRAYRSQFYDERNERDEPETNISHPGFLEAIIARGKQYGSYVGVTYGEPFLVREPLRLDDPVEFFGEEYRRSFL